MKSNNKLHINNKEANNKCTSCQICYAVCPVDAISIKLNKEGFFRPYVNEDMCIGCQKCNKFCYKFDTETSASNIDELKSYNHYAAETKDKELILCTSSGGVASEIAHYLHKEGYTIVGVRYNTATDQAERCTAQSIDDIKSFRGTKYIHADNMSALKEIVTRAKAEGTLYAFFGLPCEIYAVNKFAVENHIRDQFILVDLYCHGVPSYLLWHKYIKETKAKCKTSEISQVIFRSKYKSTWGQFKIEVKDGQNNTIYLSKKNASFYDLFFSDQLLNKSCYDCKLRGNLGYCDIRLGDFWGPKYLLNFKGKSVVTVVTSKGNEIFEGLNHERLCSEDASVNEFAPYQSLFHNAKDLSLRSVLLEKLREKETSIESIISYYDEHSSSHKGTKAKIKRVLMAILPYKIIQTLKYMYYKLR